MVFTEGHGKWLEENKEAVMHAVHDAVLTQRMSEAALPHTSVDNSVSSRSWARVKDQMSFWSPDTAVFIFRDSKMEVDHAEVYDGGCLGRADGFPGATVLVPLSSNQWSFKLVCFMVGVLLTACGLGLEARIDLDISKGKYDSDTPLLARTFFAMSVTTFVSITFIACQRTYQEVAKGRAWSASTRKEAARYFLSKMMLRFVGLPHFVLNLPPDMFVAGHRLGDASFLAYPELPLMAYMSRSQMRYDHNSGFITKIPKVVLGDCAMGILKLVFLNEHSSDMGIIMAATLAFVSMVYSLWTFRGYLAALLDYAEDLGDLAGRGNAFAAQGRLKNLPLAKFREFSRGRWCLRKFCGCHITEHMLAEHPEGPKSLLRPIL